MPFGPPLGYTSYVDNLYGVGDSGADAVLAMQVFRPRLATDGRVGVKEGSAQTMVCRGARRLAARRRRQRRLLVCRRLEDLQGHERARAHLVTRRRGRPLCAQHGKGGVAEVLGRRLDDDVADHARPLQAAAFRVRYPAGVRLQDASLGMERVAGCAAGSPAAPVLRRPTGATAVPHGGPGGLHEEEGPSGGGQRTGRGAEQAPRPSGAPGTSTFCGASRGIGSAVCCQCRGWGGSRHGGR